MSTSKDSNETSDAQETFDAVPVDLKRTGLTTHQAADKLGRSVAWIKLHATDLGGVMTRRGFRFPEQISLERVTEKITLRAKMTSPSVLKEDRDGENARKVFDLLDQCIPTREIVKRTSLPAHVVLTIAKQWIQCGQFDQNELAIIHGRRQPDAPSAVVFNPPAVTVPAAPEGPDGQMTPEERNLIPVKRESVRERIAILRREIETGVVAAPDALKGENT